MGKPTIERDPTFEVTTNCVVATAEARQDASPLDPVFSKHTESYINECALAAPEIQSRPMSRPNSCRPRIEL